MNGQFPTSSSSISMLISETMYRAVVGIDDAVQTSISLIKSKK